MLQAIRVKFLGPTDTRGARLKASCAAGSKTVSWDYGWSYQANYEMAAYALAKRLGWDGEYRGGELADGSFVYVRQTEDKAADFVVPSQEGSQ